VVYAVIDDVITARLTVCEVITQLAMRWPPTDTEYIMYIPSFLLLVLR